MYSNAVQTGDPSFAPPVAGYEATAAVVVPAVLPPSLELGDVVKVVGVGVFVLGVLEPDTVIVGVWPTTTVLVLGPAGVEPAPGVADAALPGGALVVEVLLTATDEIELGVGSGTSELVLETPPGGKTTTFEDPVVDMEVGEGAATATVVSLETLGEADAATDELTELGVAEVAGAAVTVGGDEVGIVSVGAGETSTGSGIITGVTDIPGPRAVTDSWTPEATMLVVEEPEESTAEEILRIVVDITSELELDRVVVGVVVLKLELEE
jgi:hypothetical protein